MLTADAGYMDKSLVKRFSKRNVSYSNMLKRADVRDSYKNTLQDYPADSEALTDAYFQTVIHSLAPLPRTIISTHAQP